MAKTAEKDPFAFDPEAIDLHVVTPTIRPGKYDAHINAMIEADEKLAQDNPDAFAKGARTAVTVVFPGPHRETKTRPNGQEYEAIIGDEAKFKRFFQDSAKARNRTAKVESVKDQGTGQVVYEFTLKPQVKHRDKAVETAVETADDAAVAPEEPEA